MKLERKTKRMNALKIPGDFIPNYSSPYLSLTLLCPNNPDRMEVVGWSPSEQLSDSDMFELPPQVEGWYCAEDGDPRYVLTSSSI